MKVLLVLSILLFAAPASAQSLKWPTIVYLSASTADLASTYGALSHGGSEGNPVLNVAPSNAPITVAVGTVATIGALWAVQRFIGRHHPYLAKVVLYGASAVRLGATAQNVYVISQHR